MPKSLRIIVALLFVTAQLLIPAAMAGEAIGLPGESEKFWAVEP